MLISTDTAKLLFYGHHGERGGEVVSKVIFHVYFPLLRFTEWILWKNNQVDDILCVAVTLTPVIT